MNRRKLHLLRPVMNRRIELTKDAENQTVDTVDLADHAQMRDTFTIMEQMRKERLLCDVILSLGNIEVPAHKTVLAASSRYFYANLVLSKENQGECRITLPSTISPEALKMLVNYMYSFQIQITQENVEYLLPAAHMFMLKAVTDACCDVLQKQLTPKDCLRIKLIAEEYECSELLKKIQHYINEHFSDIVDTEQFRTLQFQQLSLLISRDTLTIPAEEKLYECVVSWLKYDLKTRKKYLTALMQHVRLPLIPVAYVVEHIINEPLFKGDLKFKDFIIETLQNYFLQKNKIDVGSDGAESTTVLQPIANDLKLANRNDSMVLVVIGGTNVSASRTIEYYDFKKGEWAKVIEVPYQVCNGAITINDNILVTGEINSTNTIFAYNVATNQWFIVNQNLTDEYISWWSRASFIANDCIFVATERSVAKFNISSRSWSTFPFLPQKRTACGIAVIDNKIFMIGGANCNSIVVYDEYLKRWSTLPLNISARYNMGIGVIDQIIYLIGGLLNGSTLKSVEILDTTTNCLKQIASLNLPRQEPGVVTFNNLLYVIGGSDHRQQYMSSIEVYDPKTNTWTLLPASMSIGRCRPAVTVANKTILRDV